MEEKYDLRNRSIKCILAFIISLFIIGPIANTIVAKTVSESGKVLGSVIINLTSYAIAAIIEVILLRKYLLNDLKALKKNWWICLIIVVVSYGFVWFGQFISKLIYGGTLTSDNQESLTNLIKCNAPLMFISICFFGPIAEELVFRKSIFAFFNDWVGLAVSVAAFSLVHVISTFDIIHILPYLFTAIFFGLFYIFSKRNIYVTILAHMIANTVAILVIIATL